MNAKLVINPELNGLELYFPDKPDDSVLTILKDAKWRYHRAKKCWYAKDTPANRSIADQLAETDTFAQDAANADPSEEPVYKGFYPPYNSVDGIEILPSASVSCWDHDKCYFADINAYMEVRAGRIIITDLTNALLPGKECVRLALEAEDLYTSECLYSGMETFREVYDKFFVRRDLPSDCRVYESKLRSIRCFTPFREMRPIKTPEKWTLTHAWKAILSGQVFQGECDGRYTDDYAYDAAVNFREGVGLHLPSFAKKLIEDPSGWWVHGYPQEDGTVKLSVNCYSFDNNSLRFDESCTWKENIRRRDRREAERQQYNDEMRSRLLSEAEVLENTKSGLIFDVTLLEMDGNTDQYVSHKEVMLRRQFIDNGHLWREVLSITPRAIEADSLYEIVCGSYVQADARVIRHDERCVVTGKALTELLVEHVNDEEIVAVSVCRQSISDLQSALDDELTGRIRNLFIPTPRSKIVEALARLAKEEERIYDA